MDLSLILQTIVGAIVDSDFFDPSQVSVRTSKDGHMATLTFWDAPVIRVESGKTFSRAKVFGARAADLGLAGDVGGPGVDGWAPIAWTDACTALLVQNARRTYEKCFLLYSNAMFGCCSRYLECSDALKCLNPNKERARACQYLRNLYAGRVFYGRNRNVGAR